MKEHQLIDIEKISVNPENPRHTQIMIADELFIMQQLVFMKMVGIHNQ